MNAMTEMPAPLVFTDAAATKVRSLIDDLRSGRLTWSDEWVRGYEPEGAAPTSPDGTP